MAIELKVPSVGESISEVIIGTWIKKEGDSVEEDESVVELDTDKASQEIGAPAAGVIQKLLKEEGDTAEPGEVIAIIDENGAPQKESGKKQKPGARPARRSLGEGGSAQSRSDGDDGERDEKSKKDKEAKSKSDEEEEKGERKDDDEEPRIMPAAKRLMEQNDIPEGDVKGTGPGGRVLKEDVQKAIDEQGESKKKKEPKVSKEDLSDLPEPGTKDTGEGRETETVRMTTLRKRIAKRLVASQQQAAILTTFNEVDMKPVMDLRGRYKESFQKKYGIKLGFMSFFVKAAVDALREMPQVNAQIKDDNIVYHNYQDIGVAVGGGKGLVVPVIRNAERLSFAEIEQTIADFGQRAQKNQITPDEMHGGTFTISNGGIYGSMLSTPIINPPQSGILGMHNIVERPVVVNGEIVVRPIMYLALSYDHRLVDGREAVTFLKRIKDCIEEPTRILMEI